MKKKELARKITSWLTLGAFSLQPALAFATEILPDSNAPIKERPLVTETTSGNPLVQITTPTAGGVSANRYEFFNVPERGAILNNSYGLASTELAGYVQGNPYLATGTARIIVNEVTSANPSELRGFLEVAGDKAGIVIANPNGILADGAGFLNTARVTLATGRTEMDASGNLASIRVEGGKLSITGNGLNAQSTDSAEIYARAIEINAGLWAKNARLAAGANEIRYADGTSTPIKGRENTLAYALDLAAIGGMYANRIELVGTEKGLGVNLAGQITSTEATSLDVNGNLKTSGNLYTDGSTHIHADEIENSGAVYSKEDTTLTASSLQNSDKIIGGADTAIHASAIANTGTLAAAIAPSGKTNDAGTLTVTAKEFDNNNAQLLSGKDIVVSAENMHTQNSRIAGNGDISLVSQNALTVENSAVQSGRVLSIEANTMPLAGNLSANRDMRLTLHTGGLSNEAATENFGNLHAGRNLTANLRGNVYNQRKLEAAGMLSLATTGNLTQTATGEISGKSLAIHTADMENRGLMQADEEAAITASNLKNDATGRIYGNTLHVQASHIRNEKNANLEARLTEEMHLLKEKAELLEAAHRVDVTKFTSQADIAVYNANIQSAESAYDAQQKVVDAVKAELAALPSGVIAAREALALQANSIQNSGNALLYSGGDLSLAAKEEVANRGARVEAQGSISIAAPLTKNENAAFSAKRVITETKDNPVKLRIDEGSHIEQGQAFPAEEFREINSGYGAYHSYVAPKAILEPAEYKPIEQISEEERAAGEKPIPDELIGTLAPTYAYGDPIFKQFGIASMSTDRPAADDPARRTWDEAYKKILAKLNEKITAYNAEAKAYNQKIGTAAGQKIIHFTVIRSRSILSKEHVTSSLPGSIRAGANILLNSAVENEDSNIVAGGTLHATGAVKEDTKKQQELAATFGTTQGSYTERRNWLHRGKVRKYHGVVFMTPEITKSNPSPIGVQTYATRAAMLRPSKRRTSKMHRDSACKTRFPLSDSPTRTHPNPTTVRR